MAALWSLFKATAREAAERRVALRVMVMIRNDAYEWMETGAGDEDLGFAWFRGRPPDDAERSKRVVVVAIAEG